MFSLIVFTSFALFMWAAMIRIIYQKKLHQYNLIKKKINFKLV